MCLNLISEWFFFFIDTNYARFVWTNFSYTTLYFTNKLITKPAMLNKHAQCAVSQLLQYYKLLSLRLTKLWLYYLNLYNPINNNYMRC